MLKDIQASEEGVMDVPQELAWDARGLFGIGLKVRARKTELDTINDTESASESLRLPLASRLPP